MLLGDVIRQARGSKSQSQLARESGINPAQISMIESGERTDPQFSTMVKIARALGISLDSLADSAPRKVASPLEQRLHEVEEQLKALSPIREAMNADDRSLENRVNQNASFTAHMNTKIEKLQSEVELLKQQQRSMSDQLSKVIQAQLLQQEELEERLGSDAMPLREADGTS